MSLTSSIVCTSEAQPATYAGSTIDQALKACADFTSQAEALPSIASGLVNAGWEERRARNVSDDEYGRSRTLRKERYSIWYRFSDREHRNPVYADAKPVEKRTFGCTINPSVKDEAAASNILEAYEAITGIAEENYTHEHPEYGFVRLKKNGSVSNNTLGVTIYFTMFVPLEEIQ